MTDSSVVSQGACPSCSSSDAYTEYDDGHAFCFSCRGYWHSAESSPQPTLQIAEDKEPLVPLEYQQIKARGLTLQTCEKWKYGFEDGKNSQVATYCCPKTGRAVAQKVKYIKDGKKKFGWPYGNRDRIGLYGEQLWKPGGKTLIITEGEIDAMSVSQVQDHKWPVVSIPDGAGSAVDSIKKSIEFVSSFERIVLMFDSDEKGQEAALAVAEVLPAGRAFIAHLPLKDANEMLQQGKGDQIIKAMWNATPWRPDGIVAAGDLFDRILDYRQRTSHAYDYEWPGLQARTRGQRPCELTLWTGGTGGGKSETVRQVALDLMRRHGQRVGYLALEEPAEKTAMALFGMHLGKRIQLEEDLDLTEYREEYEAFVKDRLFLYDHFGSQDTEALLSKMRYLVDACECPFIVLDHVSMAVSGLETRDERKDIDILLTKLRSFAQEKDIHVHTICHLRRASRFNPAKGDEIEGVHLRGSGSLETIPDNCFGLERDQQSETRKHYTHCRILKCRWTGATGPGPWFQYGLDTGLQTEVAEPPEEEGEFHVVEDNEDF